MVLIVLWEMSHGLRRLGSGFDAIALILIDLPDSKAGLLQEKWLISFLYEWISIG